MMSSKDGELPHRVFVYGTLKKGQPNEHLMENKERGKYRFLAHAVSVDKYPLVIATSYQLPYLLDAKGEGHNVHGDVYEVDDRMMAYYDEIESHPVLYERDKMSVRLITSPDGKECSDQGSEAVECWCYFLRKYKKELLTLPMIANYTGTNYVEDAQCTAPWLSDLLKQLRSESPPTDEETS